MVHQHFSLVADMTVVENLMLGQSRGVLRRTECARRVRALAEQYGLASTRMRASRIFRSASGSGSRSSSA